MIAIVSYYPSTNKIFAVYDSVEEAEKAVKFLNCFSKLAGEKLQIAYAELSEAELEQLRGEEE